VSPRVFAPSPRLRDDVAPHDPAEDVHRIALTFESDRMSRKALVTCSAVAPPPTSRKFAGRRRNA